MHGFHFYLTFHYYHISLFYWEIVWEVRYNVGNCKQWPQQTYADWLDKKSECSKWMVQPETMIHVSFLFSFSAISMFCDSWPQIGITFSIIYVLCKQIPLHVTYLDFSYLNLLSGLILIDCDSQTHVYIRKHLYSWVCESQWIRIKAWAVAL